MISGILTYLKPCQNHAPKGADIFKAPPLSRYEAAAMEKVFARLFATEDGRKALAYLQSITFMRVAAMDAAEQSLRYVEGQRALMATILRLIERGQAGS